MQNNRYWIDRVSISKVNLKSSIIAIETAIEKKTSGYICVTNARTTYISNHDYKYCKIQNDSLLTVPDGAPLVWIAHRQGYKNVGRVSGKNLMDALFEISTEKGYSHYFFGSTPETIAKIESHLNKKYPLIEIKGIISPPFQPLEDFDIDTIAQTINSVKPTFFWCGLGAPKQEHLIALLQPKLTSTICVGVGLAFEYIAGTVKRAPIWMQNLGLEWMYRLAQQPKNISRAVRPLSWIFIKLLTTTRKKHEPNRTSNNSLV